jgi:hypothetical protein
MKERGIKDDPPLGDGFSQWVPQAPYRVYYTKYGGQVEVTIILHLQHLHCTHLHSNVAELL